MMKNMTLEHIAQACDGTYRGSELDFQKEVTGVVLDSRKVEEDFCFIATRNGNMIRFINSILSCTKCIVQHFLPVLRFLIWK